jgi:hypothetical protein
MTDALDEDAVELIGRLKDISQTLRDNNAYYPSSPQEAIMGDQVQEWMDAHGLPRFTGQGHMSTFTKSD